MRARRWLAAYGLSISFGQFALMFMAIAQGMPTGLAALLHQAQVFFTVLMAAWWLGEPVRRHQALGMALAALGLGLIGAGQYRGALPMSALALVLASALSWAAGNLVVKRMARFGPVNALALVGWGNVPSLLAFAPSALALDGLPGVWQQVRGLNAAGWSALLARHPAGRVTPLALLAPAIALLVAWAVLGEQLNAWQAGGIALVAAALLLHVFGPPLAQRLARVWARGRA